ncbi:MAG: hypothetical protein JOZ69_22030 [Myxococcales bacterium]|nr:hypothetical protein [Myxococcales bacterium]
MPLEVAAADAGRTKRSGRWVFAVLLLAIAAAGGYLVLNGYVDRVLKPSENAPSAPPPAVAAPVPPPPAVAPPAPRSSAASATSLAPAPSLGPPSPHAAGSPSSALSGFAPSVTVGPRPGATGLAGHPSPKKGNGEDNNPY